MHQPFGRQVLRCCVSAFLVVTIPEAAEAQASERIVRAASRTVLGGIPPELIAPILTRFGVPQQSSTELLQLLSAVLNAPPVPEQYVIEQLVRHGVSAPLAGEAARALLAISRGTGAPNTRKDLSDFLLTHATASLGADRALTTTTLVEFVRESWALRVVTAGAVSNADTTGSQVPAGTTQELYRTRTADLLTLLQVGGNAVLRSHHDMGAPNAALTGAFTIEAGMMGDWLNPKTDSRYTVGSSLQGRWMLGNVADPVRLIILGRGGWRWVKAGILTDDPEHKLLTFLTGSLEFHLAGGQVPFGLSFNAVNHPFREYGQLLHVYTTLRK